MKKIIIYTVSAAVIGCMAPMAAAQSEDAAIEPNVQPGETLVEVQEIQMELAQLSQEISAIEQEARETEPVKEKMDAFRNSVVEEMVRRAPELEDEIIRQGELVDELNSNGPEAMDDTERHEKMAEYQLLRQQIEPIEIQVQQSESVIAARDAFYESLTEEMRKIDPRTDELLDRYRQASIQLNELQGRS